MRYHTSRVAALCLLATLGTAMVGCASTGVVSTSEAASAWRAQALGASVPGLHVEGVLTVGLRSSSPAPLVVRTDDVVEGYEVEAACTLADHLGLPVTFKLVTDVDAALGDTCDVVVGATAGDDFEVVGDVTESALAFFRKGEPGVVSAADLDGKSIALQEGSASQLALEATLLKVTETPCDTLDKAFKMLETGQVDYVLCHATSGAYLATHYDDIALAGLLNEPAVMGIALPAGEGELQTAVRDAYAQMESDGTLAEARRRWLGDFARLTAEQRVADIPMPDDTSDAPQVVYEAEEVGSLVLDGSMAGANAASLSTFGQADPNDTAEATTYEDGTYDATNGGWL